MRGNDRAMRARGIWALIVAGALSAPLVAQDEGPNSGAISWSAGFDLATAYYYRGIPQEDQGVITQPYMGLDITIVKQTDSTPVGVSTNFGTWNSLHSNTSSNPWYESDFYAGLGLALPANFSFGLTYVYLYGPNAGDFFSEELQFSLGYSDAALWEKLGLSPNLALNPSVLFIQEIDGGSDGLGDSGSEGSLVELAIEPGITLLGDTEYPVSLGFPVKLGLNLGDYYETGTGDDDDETFGYLDLAITAGVPLAFIPPRFGSWSASASFHVLVLGDSPQEIGSEDFGVSSDFDDVETWGSLGVSVSY